MNTITNTWVEKERKKRVNETAPSYTADKTDYFKYSTRKPASRHSPAARASMVRTLRGIRR